MEKDDDCVRASNIRWARDKYDVLFAVSWHLVSFQENKFKSGVEFNKDMDIVMNDAIRNPMDGD